MNFPTLLKTVKVYRRLFLHDANNISANVKVLGAHIVLFAITAVLTLMRRFERKENSSRKIKQSWIWTTQHLPGNSNNNS